MERPYVFIINIIPGDDIDQFITCYTAQARGKNCGFKKFKVSKIRYLCESINNLKNMNQKLGILRQLLAALIIIAAIGGLSSCEKYSWVPEKVNPVDTVHFATEIQPVFTANCASCHGGARQPDLREGKSYESLTTGGYVNQPGETSVLYTKMTAADHASRSNDVEKQKVLIWINQGALNN